jgi:phosphatidylserine/phosphatidylglycerophosphate/cardiolipin synthase-like enzyme
MNRIFSNGGQRDFVQNPFDRFAESSARLFLAAPYFNKADLVAKAAQSGKAIQLLVGLNPSTSHDALSRSRSLPNVNVRYLTRRFHAKIFIFDNAVLLGSSNLTDAGFFANREAVICLDRPEDSDAIAEVRSLFLELWESARVLTDAVLRTSS